MIKDYIFHIAPNKSIANDIQSDCGYIIISAGSHYDELDICDNVLLIHFADTEERMRNDAISFDDVRRIIKFLKQNIFIDVFVTCDAGESRSPAVVAGLLKISGRDDSYIWDSKDYRPNVLVYNTILEYCKADNQINS